MAEDEGRDDATLAETLGAFGARPLLDGAPEPDDAPPGRPTPEWHPDEGPEADGSRLGRLLGWVRWAAAPLGFFLFLSALTAYGVLRDRDGSSTTGSSASASRAGAAPATTSAPATTATTPAPATTATSSQPAVTATAGPRATVSTATPPRAATGRSAASPPPASAPAPTRSSAANSLPVRYFGPACGHAPGQTIAVTIDGRRLGPATADADGCVSLTYYGPACGYAPGEWVEVVLNGRPQLPVRADADGCVAVTR